MMKTIKALDVKQSKALTIRYLARFDRSTQDVRKYLEKKIEDHSIIDIVIRDFVSEGILDDKRYAVNFVRSKIEGRRLGTFRIRRELKHKGIENDLIEQAFYELSDSISEEERAIHWAEKKMKSMASLPPEKQYRRLIHFLAGKGFDSDTIYKTWSKVKSILLQGEVNSS